jgi:hypothetical protein
VLKKTLVVAGTQQSSADENVSNSQKECVKIPWKVLVENVKRELENTKRCNV